jgi:hypothetical protein
MRKTAPASSAPQVRTREANLSWTYQAQRRANALASTPLLAIVRKAGRFSKLHHCPFIVRRNDADPRELAGKKLGFSAVHPFVCQPDELGVVNGFVFENLNAVEKRFGGVHHARAVLLSKALPAHDCPACAKNANVFLLDLEPFQCVGEEIERGKLHDPVIVA